MAGSDTRDATVNRAPDSNRLRRGASYAWRGFAIIREPTIRAFVIIPLLINMALFSLGLVCLAMGLNYVMDAFLPDWLDWLSSVSCNITRQ